MKKILVVDNDRLILEFVQDLLSREGHQVKLAEDGLAALDVLKAYRPDVMFIDLVMPRIDGKRLLSIIRKDSRLRDTALIVLSSIAAEEEKNVTALGADACIVKGSFREMAQRIRSVLDKKFPAPSGPPSRKASQDIHPGMVTGELISAKRHFEVVLEKMSEGILEITDEGRIIYANPSAVGLIRIPEEELIGRHLAGLFSENDHQRIEEAVKGLSGASISIGENAPAALNEHQVTLSIIPIEGDGPTTAIVILNDITERLRAQEVLQKAHGRLEREVEARTAELSENNVLLQQEIKERIETERALRESEFKFRSLFDLSPQAIALSEMDTGKIINVNDRLCDLIGYSRDEIVGQLLTEVGFVSRNDMDRLLHSLKESGEVQAEEIGVEAKNGTILDTLLFARSIRFSRQSFILSIFLDLTERNRLEQQFIHAQKMEAIGTLAGGIAHDFNNLLMGMQGNASLLLLDMPGDHPHHDKIKNIEVHIKRGAELTRQLLGFARGGKYEIQPIDINELVRTSAHMFGRTRKEITIREDYQKDPWGVEVDSGQIDQVLLNIFINAWQAMPNGGDLVLTTQNVLLHERDSGPLGMEPGRHIKISVKDTGLGMDAETQKRIFEPFFTTRPRGRGTGLGLASAYGIVKNHGGSIHVESSPGNGTRFDIYLPASDKKTLTDQPTSQEITKGSETVLLVDDEDMIVEVGQGLLERLGYRALTAKTGKDAIATYKKNLDQIDMVILDMVMPDMGGGETFDRLREVNPNVKVLLSSGYTVEGEAAEILKRGCDGFIQKPFDVQQLSQKLHELLDKGH